MIRSIVLIAAAFFFTGCTHTVIRKGYDAREVKRNGPCQVRITKGSGADMPGCRLLGQVRVGESGFSMACGEDDALEIFRREACGIGADEVRIVKERRPSFWSSCYRATALLMKRDPAPMDSSRLSGAVVSSGGDKMDDASVRARVKDDHKRNVVYMIVAILCGASLGFAFAMAR